MADTPAGRRGNGLQSADWGALVDLDPRLAESLLDRLAAAGVAAYVEPASAAGDPWPRAPLPSRPLDRLWVDPGQAQAARDVVAAEVADLSALLAEAEPGATAHGLVQPVPRHAARRVLPPPPLPDPPTAAAVPPAAPGAPGAPGAPAVPGPPAPPPTASVPPAASAQERPDDDELFRQIVAGFDTPSQEPVPRWPVSEDTGPAGRGPAGPPDLLPPDLDAARRRPPPVDRAPRRRRDDDALPAWLEPEALDEADRADPDIDGGHYVPPPPPPAPRVSLRTLGGVAVLALGLALVLVPNLLRQPATAGVLLFGVALMVGGAALLVLQVRDAPPHDTGPDDGAVV